MAGLKMHLAFAPMGKDLTEAWQAGCDIAAFVRGIVRDPGYAFTPPAWSHAEYINVSDHDRLADVLGGLKGQTVYLCFCSEHGAFAFASENTVWAGHMQDVGLSAGDLSGLSIICEDPVETRAAFQSTVSLSDFDSVLYLAAELNGKSQSLDDLEIKYFGGAVPEQPADDSPDKWIQYAADRCAMLRKVYIPLRESSCACSAWR